MKKYNIEHKNDIAVLCRKNETAEKVHLLFKTPSKLFIDTELDRFSSYWARFFCDFLRCYYDKNIYGIDFVNAYFDREYQSKSYFKALDVVNKLFSLRDTDLFNNVSLIILLAEMVYPKYKNEEVVVKLKQILLNYNQRSSFKPADDNQICILTLHKSKGLEYKAVFLLDLYKWIFPREKCSKDNYIQDLNLHYVGITRSKEVCYIMQGNKRFSKQYGTYINAEESSFLKFYNLPSLRCNIDWEG
ncbi:ATP-dependent DNA helicase Rep [Methanosarcinaceae archaeon Ag5]|uniref:ATP-dependent DNA helicase Rep n=1 Tax=Methanolapillus africanus TaxID=3028297 RepID=A0AAE4MM17_9EURY|nr:ATP-dependent DNA helicase Rep [Methanosarcinaceae archaeon Ag5]